MRPGRILLFLLAVVLTLSVLSLLTVSRQAGEAVIQHEPEIAVEEKLQESDTITPAVVTPAHLPGPGDILRDAVADGRQARIIYYGDSQVEGDRVTSLLRRELRQEGGGTGPGMISPVMPVMYTRSWVIRSSSNWKRYTLLDYKDGKLPHNRLGPMLALCRFTPPGDTMLTRSFASVKVSAVPGADPSVSVYDNLRIFYGNYNDTVLVGINQAAHRLTFQCCRWERVPWNILFLCLQCQR